MEEGVGMGIWGGWKKGNESANAKINILPIPAKAGISLSTGAGRATLALHRFLLLSESQTTQKKILHFFGKKAGFDIQWTRCFAKPTLLEENGRGDESHF